MDDFRPLLKSNKVPKLKQIGPVTKSKIVFIPFNPKWLKKYFKKSKL